LITTYQWISKVGGQWPYRAPREAIGRVGPTSSRGP
jgi:hypothetical protein